MNIAITFRETCRRCGLEQEFEIGSGEIQVVTDEQLVDSLRAFALKRDGWLNGCCPACLEPLFLDEADKADHDNKCQRELDP